MQHVDVYFLYAGEFNYQNHAYIAYDWYLCHYLKKWLISLYSCDNLCRRANSTKRRSRKLSRRPSRVWWRRRRRRSPSALTLTSTWSGQLVIDRCVRFLLREVGVGDACTRTYAFGAWTSRSVSNQDHFLFFFFLEFWSGCLEDEGFSSLGNFWDSDPNTA